jgi:FdhD protein
VDASSSAPEQIKPFAIRRVNGGQVSEDTDLLAAEEPLEIRIEGTSIAVVMRTPGDDRELTAGFLVTEGLLSRVGDLIDIQPASHCYRGVGALAGVKSENGTPSRKAIHHTAVSDSASNVVEVLLSNRRVINLSKLTRHVFSSSSCGVCSKASIEAVRQQFPPINDVCEVDAEVLLSLPRALAVAQQTFKRTGGLHACALFNLSGKMLLLREDVGRHNALDKVIGWCFLEGRLPLRQHILLLSGRASFEMLQKSLAAGIPIVAAISAPSSLAVEFARVSGQTLVGFLRGEKMNVYSGHARLRSNGKKP